MKRPERSAAGVTGVAVSLHRSWQQMGVVRSVRTLPLVNQHGGFDCPGCAWPDPQGHRKVAEFCENGAKAVAEEATTRRIGADFFAQHSLSELEEKTDHSSRQPGSPTATWWMSCPSSPVRNAGREGFASSSSRRRRAARRRTTRKRTRWCHCVRWLTARTPRSPRPSSSGWCGRDGLRSARGSRSLYFLRSARGSRVRSRRRAGKRVRRPCRRSFDFLRSARGSRVRSR